MSEEKKFCSRCGKCCFYPDELGIPKKCKYLAGNLRKSCRIYNSPNRIGKVIDIVTARKIFCVPRKEYPIKIDGCTYL